MMKRLFVLTLSKFLNHHRVSIFDILLFFLKTGHFDIDQNECQLEMKLLSKTDFQTLNY